MLIVLETGRRDLQRIFMEQAANPDGALQRFMAAVGTELQHVADMHHLTADAPRRHNLEFFAYETIGVVMPPSDRALAAMDFS